MNFLAHLHLSGSDHDIMIGNFIGDFVRGRNLKEQFGEGIARGIELHRAIDEFTDTHAIVQQSKNRLHPKYRHYAGVIVDMFYDHYLAKNWSTYHDQPLEQYAQEFYALTKYYNHILPERAKRLLIYMTQGNWLVNYGKTEGIHRALSGMASRTPFESKMEEAVGDLVEHNEEFQEEFRKFFPELHSFSVNWLKDL
ncbi:MAG TPA: ACP phosphodiesterase [Cyclobacteriaceae bacterium]|mgnify:FL=1|nr:ACP phosphodiesterase [Cyclobacteriaceae bacterium]